MRLGQSGIRKIVMVCRYLNKGCEKKGWEFNSPKGDKRGEISINLAFLPDLILTVLFLWRSFSLVITWARN